ncbi:DASH complex subunit Dad4 [Pyrrhoderma noxium]|uniref:DASH complex subunit DAD4 n=1 Tax=Pyrrhoderma noxium TaxID=2282107 RepID=A0A286UGZ0_9AGAM|nr:DASH complex subunit Dad4 [Pyrrhoderma noxium]
MENPHSERQAVLLERIVKNTEKCIEVISELNHCLEEITRANRDVRTASSLVTKYRRNVQYNLEATRVQQDQSTSTPTP